VLVNAQVVLYPADIKSRGVFGNDMAYKSRFVRLVCASVLAILSTVTLLPVQADENDFPIPANIRPAVDFWIKVFTQPDTEHGYLHDSENLAVVYAELPRGSAGIDSRRKEIITDLNVLASGKRTDLTTDQQYFLSLWGSDVSATRLQEAAKNIRWQLGQSDRFKEGLIRSGAYRAHIENLARAKGLPTELAALPHVESSFHPGANSSVAATGLWQFMRESAKPYMRVDALVDERLDPYKASNAALDMLQDNYEALGSWPLALTAYNHGANGMARAVRDTGSRDIGRIISEYTGPRFGFASRNFYPEFLAALEVERDAERYFGSFSKDAAPDFAQYELTAFVDANVIAHNLGVGLEDLRKDNPALQAAIWSGNKRVPKGYILKINKNLLKRDIVTGFNAIAASEFYPAQVPDVSYLVRSGDSLSGIASQYNTTVAELVAINQLRDRNAIRVGQKIILPQRNGVVPTLVVKNATEIPQDGEYRVRRGDTISTIAAKFKLTTTTLLALNNMRTGNLIHPGQMLRLNPESSTVQTKTDINTQQQDTVQTTVEVVPPAIATLAPTVSSATVSVPLETLAANIPTAANSQNVSLPSAQLTHLYEVATDNTIEILADETLGHYANWLGQDAGVLRRLNNIRANASVQLGKRIKLDFSKVDKTNFEKKRAAHHQNLHASFFDKWRVTDTQNYSIKKSDLVLNLARERAIPMWLFKQYNQEVDSSDVKIGQVVVFPVVEKIVN